MRKKKGVARHKTINRHTHQAILSAAATFKRQILSPNNPQITDRGEADRRRGFSEKPGNARNETQGCRTTPMPFGLGGVGSVGG